MAPTDRTYDVVLLGATGFTGALTAAQLVARAPDLSRIALAGRNRGKLEGVRDRLAQTDPRAADLELLQADVTDASSLRQLAESTTVVATTVGPYNHHGEPLVAACAAAGTSYVDLTGEPEFVDRMYVQHHAEAVRTGARIVHACGFDSIPYDLGALVCVDALPDGVPLKLQGYVRAGGTASAGTFHSAVTQFGRLRDAGAVHKQRRGVEPRPEGRRVRTEGKLHRHAGKFALPLPTVDPQVVRHSAEVLERYGPEFTYGHYALVKSPVVAGVAPVALGGLVAAAQVKPVRELILGRMSSGQGPTDEQRAKGWFDVRIVGEGGGRTVEVKVAGGDPGYTETARMFSEAALCLALDDNPPSAGSVTTAIAMGDHLVARLREIGMTLEVL